MSIGFSKKKDFQNCLDHTSRIGMNKIYIIKMAVTKMNFFMDADSVVYHIHCKPTNQAELEALGNIDFKSINSQGLEAFWKTFFSVFYINPVTVHMYFYITTVLK